MPELEDPELKECSRCGDTYRRPGENTMNYVRSEDFAVDEEQEVLYVERLNESGREVRDGLVEAEGLTITQANTVMGRRDETYLDSVADEIDSMVDREETDEPVGPETDPDVLRTITEAEIVTDVRTGLVCDDCLKEEDEQIW